MAELMAIVQHQWALEKGRGLIKGFFLTGPPGTGKTTLARRLAYELGRACQPNDPPVVLATIDGAEIARSRYGESEERILDIFAHARAGFTAAQQRSVLLFDDVESVFMARGSQHAKEWHFSQDSVFFHAVDDMDTSRTILVLTTNRPDLVDEAIRDRFLTYHIGYPDRDTLSEIAVSLSEVQSLSAEQRARFVSALRVAIDAQGVRSIRDAQRFVTQFYLAEILGRPSLSHISSLPAE